MMLHEKSCGAIVYRKYHGNTEILLIKHINSGHWSFPKGHVEAMKQRKKLPSVRSWRKRG